MNPGISVIIPTYNNAAYLSQAVESVLAQGYAPCDIVVVDDGSTDETVAVLRPFHNQIIMIQQENDGLTAACNRGLQQGQYELVLFLDARQVLLPGTLQQQAAYLQLHPELGYVSSGWQQVDAAGTVLQTVEPWHTAPELHVADWLKYKPMQLGAIMFRRIWLNRVGELDAELCQAYDIDLMLRLSLAGCTGAWLYKPTIQNRPQLGSAASTAVQAQSVLRVLDKFFASPNLPEPLPQGKASTYFYTLLWLGWQATTQDDVETAVAMLRQNLALAPSLNINTPEQTVVVWLVHFSQWERENGRTAPLSDAVWAIFKAATTEVATTVAAAPEANSWLELQRLAAWWQSESAAAARPAFTPFDLWRIFQSGLDWERGVKDLSAELVLAWWALIWQPYVQKRFADALTGWALFVELNHLLLVSQLKQEPAKLQSDKGVQSKNLRQSAKSADVSGERLVQLVRVGLAAEPGAVNSTVLSQLWQDARAHGWLVDADFDEPTFFAALPQLRRPRVSVIVPVYNGAAHIVETVESVLAQTYTDWELIVVDDGSTDGTADLLRPYLGQLRLIQQQNQGVSAARNRGLRLALGDFVLFLDGDDLLYKEKLKHQVALLESDHLLGAVHSGWRMVDAYGRSLRPIRPWAQVPELDLVSWLQWKPVFLGAMLFRRSWLLRIDGFRTDLRQAEDTDFLLRLSLAGCPMRWHKRITIDYRQHGAGVTQNGRRQAQDLLTVMADFFSNPQLPAPILTLKPSVQHSTLIWLVWQLYRTEYLDEIVPYLQQAAAVKEAQPPTILAQTWLVQLATFAREEGVDVAVLNAFYPYIQTALQVNDEAWVAIERMLEWWLVHWQGLYQSTSVNLYQVQQIVQGALYLEENGHIHSAGEWVEWWLKLWRCFLLDAEAGAEPEMLAFQDKSVAEIIHLAKASIVYAPSKIETSQILQFWQQAQASGLVLPSDRYLVVSLLLTFFGQSVLGRQWQRAAQSLWQAIRFSWHRSALGAWADFVGTGLQYWRNGRVRGNKA